MGWPPYMLKRRERWLQAGAASACSWLAARRPLRSGRRLPSFGPPGATSAPSRNSAPAADRTGTAPQRQRQRAGCKSGAIPPASAS
jgi:hypothetical protein